MRLLTEYSWPGNIRELQNVIERGVVLSRGSILKLGADFLPVETVGTSVEPKAIDAAQGGKLDGLLKQLVWTNDAMHIVPARGRVTTGADVKAFRDMILTVRDRVQKMVAGGQTEDQVLAAHPTADFDARWGNGRVRPDAFVRKLYSALK